MFDAIPINHQTWIICGGRDFADEQVFENAMGDLIRLKGCPEVVVCGGAKGADAMASSWARKMAIGIVQLAADWETHGKAAGPIRNQAMLDQEPDLVVAFPGGRGTADMVARARNAGVDIAEIKT